MKTPFQLQITEFDCVPATFINAFSYLFNRSQIPPIVVRQTYSMCLDVNGTRGRPARGTTRRAIEELLEFLNNFDDKHFRLSVSYCEKEEVNLDADGRIALCLKNGGVGLLRVKHVGVCWHYVLLLHMNDEWIYCFDPHPTKNRIGQGEFEFLEWQPSHKANLKISKSWAMTRSNSRKFRLGTLSERGCVLVNRINASEESSL